MTLTVESTDGLNLGVEKLFSQPAAGFMGAWSSEPDIAFVYDFSQGATLLAKGAANFVAANSEYLEIGSPVFTAYPFTIGIWVKTTTLAQQVAFWVGDSTAANQWVHLAVDSSGDAQYQLNTAGFLTITGITVADGTWHLLVGASASATDHKLYVDAESAVTSTTSKTLGTFNRTSLGRAGDASPGDHFDGQLQVAFCYERALSALEIGNLYNAGAGRGFDTVSLSAGANPPGTTDLSSFHELDEESGIRTDSFGQFHLSDNNTVTRAAGGVGIAPQVEDRAVTVVAASSQYLQADTAPVTAYPFSLSCWVKTTTTAAQTAVSLPDKDVANDYVRLGVNATGNALYAIVTPGGTTAITGIAVDDGQWHLLTAVSASATDHKLYVDAEAAVTDATSRTIPAIDRVSVGRIGDSTPSTSFDGSLSQIAVYDAVVSAAEHTEIYGVGAGVLIRDFSAALAAKIVNSWPLSKNSIGGIVDDTTGSITLTNNGAVDSLGIPAGQARHNLIQTAKDQGGAMADITQAVLASRPQLFETDANSKTAARFDGSDTAIGGGILLSDTTATILFVAKLDSVGASAGPQFFMSQHNDAVDPGWSIGIDAAEVWLININAASSKSNTYGAADTTRHIFIVVFDTTAARLYIDGAEQTEVVEAIDEDIPVNTEVFALGERLLTDNDLAGNISEVVGFSAVKSTADLNEYLDYFTSKYGIAHTPIP